MYSASKIPSSYLSEIGYNYMLQSVQPLFNPPDVSYNNIPSDGSVSVSVRSNMCTTTSTSTLGSAIVYCDCLADSSTTATLYTTSGVVSDSYSVYFQITNPTTAPISSPTSNPVSSPITTPVASPTTSPASIVSTSPTNVPSKFPTVSGAVDEYGCTLRPLPDYKYENSDPSVMLRVGE